MSFCPAVLQICSTESTAKGDAGPLLDLQDVSSASDQTKCETKLHGQQASSQEGTHGQPPSANALRPGGWGLLVQIWLKPCTKSCSNVSTKLTATLLCFPRGVCLTGTSLNMKHL